MGRKSFSVNSMPGVRIELTRDRSRGILSPLRLPFRHPGDSMSCNQLGDSSTAPCVPFSCLTSSDDSDDPAPVEGAVRKRLDGPVHGSRYATTSSVATTPTY